MLSETPKASGAKTVSVPKRIKLLLGLVILLGVLLAVVVGLSIENLNSKHQSSNATHEQNVQQENHSQGDNDKLIGRIGEGYFNFEIADTPQARFKGLSGRDGLAPTDALLFVFERADTYCFVMRDMKFNIDILWFNDTFELVYDKRNLSPDTYPESYCPDTPAKYVVELAAGVADDNQINQQSKLQIDL